MDLNTYYRALIAYRKHTADDRDCARQRKTVAGADADKDLIEIVRTDCVIEDDWIEAIEKGLIHVEKAIAEERQFIRSNGEVVPIEKVKQVSKDSVEHLARHGNLITRKPESGRDIIPDGLYTVERLADYAVYENRFLYMMLCFLRDFIAFRYDKIVELTNTYDGKLTVKKHIKSRNRSTKYELILDEKIKNDPYLRAHNPLKDKIDRIDLIYKTVLAFLNTPLMESVAKAPMLKPPITETNVLRMNKNFKGAKELYYFISSYNKQGFTVKTATRKINPFTDEIADEFAELVALNSFLTYEHGLGIEKNLKAEYELEEKKAKEREKQQKTEQIKNLQRHIKQNGGDVKEYLLLLEQRIKQLESDSTKLGTLQAQYQALENEYTELKSGVDDLRQRAEMQKAELDGIHETHQTELDKINEEHKTEISQLNSKHGEEIKTLNDLQTQKVEEFNAEINRITEEFNLKLAAQKEECEQRVKKAEEEKYATINECNAVRLKMDSLTAEKLLVEARLNSLLHEHGLFTTEDDFSSQESFDEIEKQYKAFKEFFKGEWKNAKKRIRREMLNPGNIKNISEGERTFEPTQTSIDFDAIFGPTKPPKPPKEGEQEIKPAKQLKPAEDKNSTDIND
ncbi:MAG: DUF2357 domain-containing protein [Clostridia bacterium]|nr:DUF2357 domain-containing protein [Clostridia bacterium]